jgi:hypothetical protein
MHSFLKNNYFPRQGREVQKEPEIYFHGKKKKKTMIRVMSKEHRRSLKGLLSNQNKFKC